MNFFFKIMEVRTILFVLMIFFSIVAKAQFSIDSLRTNKYYKMAIEAKSDSNYVKKYSERFAISPVFISYKYGFTVSDVWPIGAPLNFYPNVNKRLGFRARYKGIGLGVSFQLPSNEYVYGKTQSQNLSLNLQLTYLNWGSDLFFLRNVGHYIENANSAVNGWIYGTPYPIRPDLIVTNFGFSTQAILSNKFSMKAALSQTEKQIKSAGGFSLGGAFYFSRFSADSTLIPAKQAKAYTDIDSLTSASFMTFAVAPGYSYTYVYEDFFITGMFLVGVGPQIQFRKLEGPTGSVSMGLRLTAYLNYRLVFGYNTEKYYASIIYNFINNKGQIKDSKFTFEQKGLTFLVGIRIN